MTLVSYFRAVIDTDGRSPDRGHRLEVLVEAGPFGSAAACQAGLLDAYRPSFPHVVVTVADDLVLGTRLPDGRLSAARPGVPR